MYLNPHLRASVPQGEVPYTRRSKGYQDISHLLEETTLEELFESNELSLLACHLYHFIGARMGDKVQYASYKGSRLIRYKGIDYQEFDSRVTRERINPKVNRTPSSSGPT